MADKPLTREGNEAGLLPMFDLMNAFVDGALPKTIGDLITEFNIQNIEEFGNLEPDQYIPYVVLFVVCVAIGVLSLLFFPLCGCCFGCCRCCCGCCKPEKKASPLKPKKCKQYTCSTVFFILTATMLSMVVCSFVTTSMLKGEVGKDGQAMTSIVSGLTGFEDYLDHSLDDIEQAVFPPLNKTIEEAFTILDQLPNTTIQTLAKESGVDPALYQLEEYAQNIPTLNGNLTGMDNSRDNLITLEGELETELATVNATLAQVLTDCINLGPPSQRCEDLMANMGKLAPDAQYQYLDDVEEAILITQAAVDNDIPQEVSSFVDDFEAIATEIDQQVGDNIDEIKVQVDEIYAKVKEEFDGLSERIGGIAFDDAVADVEEARPTIEQYGTYAYQYFYVISALCLIPVILYLVGLPLGTVGGPASAKHASNCMYAGIIITFIFGFFFLLTTVLTFVVGGAVQGVACRHVIGYDESMQKLEKVIRNDIQDGKEDPYNLTGAELIDNCKNDKALYTAFQLAQNGFNVSEFLDLANTPIPGVIEALKNVTFNIGEITIINDDVNNAILAIENQTNSIDFNEYQDELSKGITKVDLRQYVSELRQAADEVSGLDTSVANSMRTEADKLEEIYNTTVKSMETEREVLAECTKTTHTITSSLALSSVMYNLTMAQDVLNTQTNSMIQAIVGNSADQVYTLLDQFAKGLMSSIENDIARCRPAYDALTELIYTPCAYILYPFNAVWFCYGTYMALGTIALFFATSLMGMFAVKALGGKIYPQGHGDFIRSTKAQEGYSLNKVAPVLDEGYLPPPLPKNMAETSLKSPREESFVVDW